jgi:alkaline phosphatase D
VLAVLAFDPSRGGLGATPAVATGRGRTFDMSGSRWTRRRVLGAAATGLGGALVRPMAAPAFVPTGRPTLTHGVQSGDAFGCAANIWTRADRPGRMTVELSERPDFRTARTVRGPMLTPDTDLTGRVRVTGVGRRTYYRVTVTSDDGLAAMPRS